MNIIFIAGEHTEGNAGELAMIMNSVPQKGDDVDLTKDIHEQKPKTMSGQVESVHHRAQVHTNGWTSHEITVHLY